MPEITGADTILKWWLDGDADGADVIVEALIRPVPRSRSPTGLAVDAIVTLNGNVIAEEAMCLGENDARSKALAMARAAIGALEQTYGRRGTKEPARIG